ncbi:MAG: ferritin-like domain-containing protein [Planctomycetota bacterium]
MKTNESQSDHALTQPFRADIERIRERARAKIKDGAVTDGYRLDPEHVCSLLNDALATEIVCVLRYRRHAFMAEGLPAEPVAEHFLSHSNDEQAHADRLAQRIVQLGGSPDFAPQGLATRSHADYAEGTTLRSMIEEDLIAERIAVQIYGELVRYFGDADSTTRRLLEDILADEEEHADEMASLLVKLGE